VRRYLCAIAGAAALSATSAVAGHDDLAAVLARAGEYVVSFERQLAWIVAEENYEQVTYAPLLFSRAGGAFQRESIRRRTRSDLLLVRPEGHSTWIQFRDVFEVDGRPVRDRSDRLEKLFLSPPRSMPEQVRRIVEESVRYNIGSVIRTINIPILPLLVLDPENQPQFQFDGDHARPERAADSPSAPADMPNSPRFRVSSEVWVVRYQEVKPQTLIRTEDGRDLPSRGRLWIEPSTGRILMGELLTGNAEIDARIEVSYQSEPLLGLLVPIEMREKYRSRRDASTIEATATYKNFRQFQVKVDETLGPVKEKPDRR